MNEGNHHLRSELYNSMISLADIPLYVNISFLFCYDYIGSQKLIHNISENEMPRRSIHQTERMVPAEARRVRDLRTDKDLSQKQIADVLHISQRAYADYELGNVRIPVQYLIYLAKYYNVDMNYICGITSVPQNFPEQCDYTFLF